MIKKTRFIMICIVVLSLIANSTSFGRSQVSTESKKRQTSLSTSEVPAYQIVGHRVGKIELGVNNNGSFGNGFAETTQDAITGEPVPSCEYPKASSIEYLFAGAFWIGAVVGRDTLVSTSADGWSGNFQEFLPDTDDPILDGNIIKKSLLFPDIDSLYIGAVSEEDYIMVYRDTAIVGIDLDWGSNRQHTPLNIKITQKSYAWSYDYADDFILFDYEIQNIGVQDLNDVYMGIYVDADVGSINIGGSERAQDDLSGFIETDTIEFAGCFFEDTINIAWTADNDGDPKNEAFDEDSPLATTGTRIIRTPATKLDVSYNWWVSGTSADTDFGPREIEFKGRWKEEFRDLGTGFLGTPEGDANKYYFLKNQEFDYDQPRIKQVLLQGDTLWMPPPVNEADDLTKGVDTRYLLSFGPFQIKPGERLPLSFAYVAGDSFHTDPMNHENNLPNNPDAYYSNLNFDNLTENAAWAARVYDNPGRDTDGSGKYLQFLRQCCEDTAIVDMEVYDTVSVDPLEIDTSIAPTMVFENCEEYFYRGDGIPDFQGASPPPAPKFWLTPEVGAVHIRFNGFISETSKDVFSNAFDFEGYRVYYSRDERESSYTLHSSYDIEDYNRFEWNLSKKAFELNDVPFKIEELRALYNDSATGFIFNPQDYPRTNTFSYGNDIFFFEAQDFNVSEFGINTPITRIYPDQPYPSHPVIDSITDTTEFTDDGFLKYYEYEATVKNLLPTVPYYFNVTAFDFGSPVSGLPALETSKSISAQLAYANTRADVNLAEVKKVYTYPNPYRLDGNYADLGFEKSEDGIDIADIIKAIHFANLPPVCTIKIFSLDGDLIREISHESDPHDPSSGHEKWNLITRNTQLTVSGLYYWTVESDGQETQIGKLVIIM